MAGLLGIPSGRAPNPQLTLALLVVSTVRQEVQALLPQAQATGRVTVGEAQIRRWQNALQAAADLIQRIPVPLIFPPPPFAVFANAASAQIQAALQTIRAIPVVTPGTFPPQAGQATIPLPVLQSLLSSLQQAETLLLLSVQSA